MNKPLTIEIAEAIDTLPKEIRDEIRVFTREPLDKLYEQVSIEAGILGYGDGSVESGKVETRNQLDGMRISICRLELLKRYCQNANTIDTVTASSLLVHGLASAEITSAVNLPLICCIVARVGIRKFCAEQWK